MNVDKTIANPSLVNIIKEMKMGCNKEEIFEEEILIAKFLCPIKAESEDSIEDMTAKTELKKEKQISLMSIKNVQGENFLMAFTDWDELRKWNRNENQQALILNIKNYKEIIGKTDSPYQGLAINPFGECVTINKQLLNDIGKNKEVISKEETVMVGIPAQYPSEMVNKLKEYFLRSKNVDKAYLLWMAHGRETSYLLVLDSKVPIQILFPLIGEICEPFLEDKNLDMVLADSEFGKDAIQDQEPFFRLVEN